MIDENAGLKQFVSNIKKYAATLAEEAEPEYQNVALMLGVLLAKARLNPVRTEGGGAFLMGTPGRTFDSTGPISIAPQPSQAEKDAEQEIAWKELFTPP